MALSCTSGGMFAIRTCLVPMPAAAMVTNESSPVWCLYSACPLVCRSNSRTQSLSTNLMKTCLLGPSTWIMRTVCSWSHRTSCSHSYFESRNARTCRIKSADYRVVSFNHYLLNTTCTTITQENKHRHTASRKTTALPRFSRRVIHSARTTLPVRSSEHTEIPGPSSP
jgi:hypothetical protein